MISAGAKPVTVSIAISVAPTRIIGCSPIAGYFAAMIGPSGHIVSFSVPLPSRKKARTPRQRRVRPARGAHAAPATEIGDRATISDEKRLVLNGLVDKGQRCLRARTKLGDRLRMGGPKSPSG